MSTLKKITEALVDEYGDTLCDSDTDIKMAEAVFKVIKPYIRIHPLNERNTYSWRESFLKERGYEDSI